MGFTTLSRRLSDDELTDLMERFEVSASDLIAAAGGQLVKTIGDEVMWTHRDDAAAARIGLGLVALGESGDDLPQVRAGVAHGPVTVRHGDVYGPVVNIAARLTSAARPGTLLVDREVHGAIAEDEAFRLRALKPKKVRGYEHLACWSVRPAESA